MLCPKCSHTDSKVVDSRSSEDGSSIRRRRECLACGARFTTYERREESPLMIQKKDGTIEPFDSQKLLRSLFTATVKRNIPVAELEKLVAEVEHELRDKHKSDVASHVLGDQVLFHLKDIDAVAYIRFASVYKDFKDLSEFNAELGKFNEQGQALDGSFENADLNN